MTIPRIDTSNLYKTEYLQALQHILIFFPYLKVGE